MNTSHTLERQTLAHRYLYYVLSESIISDRDYDELEKRALADPDLPADSLLHRPGSDCASSYSADVKQHALRLLKTHRLLEQTKDIQ